MGSMRLWTAINRQIHAHEPGAHLLLLLSLLHQVPACSPPAALSSAA
jgi:hypothetical protein